MNKAAFFDVDYTLYNGYTASNLTRFFVEKGYAGQEIVRREIDLQTEFSLGNIDYREAVHRALQLNVDVIKSQTVQQVDLWTKEFIESYNYIYPWANDLMTILGKKGYDVYLISASLECVVKAIAGVLGVGNFYGSIASVSGGVYDGDIDLLLNFEAKQNLVRKLLEATKHERHIGFGDSEGDVDMLDAMDIAVVYSPKSWQMISLAEKRGWFVANENNILDFAQDKL